MSDSTQQYILKKPIAIDVGKVFNGQVYELPFRQWGMKNGHACISEETFDELFVPLNRQVLTRQIAIITEKVFTYGCMAGRGDALSNKQEVYIDEAGWVDELLALFGLENKETSNE